MPRYPAYFTKLRLNYVKRMNKQINTIIENILSIKDFKDEPKPEPEKETTNDLDSVMKNRAIADGLQGLGSFLWMFQFLQT